MIGSKLYLTERDLALLTAVGRTPFLSSRELERLFFAPHGTRWARGYASYRVTRLRRLTNHGLLLAWQPAPRAHRLYALTIAGARTLTARTEIPLKSLAVFRRATLPSAPPTHFRLLAQTYTALTLALAETAAVTLADYRGEHTFRGSGNFDRAPAPDTGERLPVVPDGLAMLRRADGKQRFIFIEADTGSEPLTTIARKLRAYEGYRQNYGAELFRLRFDAPPAFSVLFVCRAARRRRNVQKTIAAELHRLGLTGNLSRYHFAIIADLPAVTAGLMR